MEWQALARRFFAAKESQARQLAKTEASNPQGDHPGEMAPEVWLYFNAGISGDWAEVRKLYHLMSRRSHQFAASAQDVDHRLASMVWQPVNESYRFYAQLSVSDPFHLLDYGNKVIRSIPSGSIYLCNSDPGRFVVTGLCENDQAGKPFFVISPNQLTDGLYQAYLESMHGASIRTLTSKDMQTAFEDYIEAAEQRAARHQSLRGEEFQMIDGRPQVKGPRAVFEITAALTRRLFDNNPGREFFVDFVNDGYPMEWMFPYFEPHGLTLRLNRTPVVSLSDKAISEDRSYWNKRVVSLLGDDFNDTNSFNELSQFTARIYVQKDLSGLTGDRRFVASEPSWHGQASHLGASAAWGQHVPPLLRCICGVSSAQTRTKSGVE